MSVTSGGTAPKPLKQRRELLLWRRLGRDRRRLLRMEFSAFAPPGPDRGFEIRGVDHNAYKAVFANRIVRRPYLQRHLMIGAEVDGLHVATGAEIPEVETMAIFVRQQIFRDDPFSNCGGNAHSLVTM